MNYAKLIAEPWDISMDGYRPASSRHRGWSQRPDPRHDARLLARRRGRHPDRRHPAGRLLGPVRRRRALAVRLGELRDRPRRLHRCATWSPTSRSTTRPTARATATAPTTTARRTSGSRARPTTRRSSPLRRRRRGRT